MPVVSKSPQIMHPDVNNSGFSRPPHNAMLQGPAKKVRKNRDDLELHRDLCVVGEAGDGHEAEELTAQLQPGVVLMDLRMPRMEGAEATSQILALLPETRVLVLLWHLAEQWGRVTSEGMVVQLRLSDQLLSTLVGCQRASVTTALQRVQDSGRLSRRCIRSRRRR